MRAARKRDKTQVAQTFTSEQARLTELEAAKAQKQAEEVAQLTSAHKAKRARLGQLLAARRKELIEAREQLLRVRSQAEETSKDKLALIEARDAASAAAADVNAKLAEAETKLEAATKEVVLHQSMAASERKRADAARDKVQAIEGEIAAREGCLAESSPSMADKARIASLQLDLNAAREQVASARAAQRKQAMDAARATSEATARLGEMQQVRKGAAAMTPRKIQWGAIQSGWLANHRVLSPLLPILASNPRLLSASSPRH